ncbi:MAG: DNA polymerase III subunit gamma/tau [Clostridia bacterium]
MEYNALYRLFRPKTFDEIVGQQHITETLKNQIKSGNISHAYLFCGTRGTGKTTAARVFAKAINCTNMTDGNPCLLCEHCQGLSRDNIDIIEMDAASNNGVDYARDIKEKVQYPPVIGKYKVYIIDEVHMLSTSAFNALLKTLEEPPQHAVFILCTTEVYKIPATILSRCMRFDFRLVSKKDVAGVVTKAFESIGKSATTEAICALAAAGEGSVRDSLSIADRCVALSDKQLTYDDVMDVLGASSKSIISALFNNILKGEVGEIFSIVNGLVNAGKDVGVLAKDLSQYARDVIVAKTVKESKRMLSLPEDVYNMVLASEQISTLPKLLYMLDTFGALDNTLRYSISPRTLFEAQLLKLATSSGEVDMESIEHRLTALEKRTAMSILSRVAPQEQKIDVSDAVSMWNAVLRYVREFGRSPLLLTACEECGDIKVSDTQLTVNCEEGVYNILSSSDQNNKLSGIVRQIVDRELVVERQETHSIDSDIKRLNKVVGMKVDIKD